MAWDKGVLSGQCEKEVIKFLDKVGLMYVAQ